MALVWSAKYSLSAYREAPSVPGVYLVGVNDPGRMHSGDEYLGRNLPDEFVPRYVGISKKSIRRRLYYHYSKRGNRNIRSHIANTGGADLEFVYWQTDGTEIEHHFLIHTMDQFIWNVKQSENGAWAKFLRAL